MSRTENYRVGKTIRTREMWDTQDIANYLHITFEKANKIHEIANKVCNITGYGDIQKEDFLECLEAVEAHKESIRLQNEANAATIVYASKNHSQNWVIALLAQVSALLK